MNHYQLILSSVNTSCPYYCKCLWRSSKITVDCGGVSLTVLPGDIASDTQVLNMSDSHMPVLHKDLFLTAGLTNLQRLYM